MKFVLLNGPPGCGKDTAASQLIPYLHFQHLKFAAPIKRMVCGLLNISMQELEELKDIPYPMLQLDNGAIVAEYGTIRQLLISLSEEVLKPAYGNDFFGRALWNDAKKSSAKMFLVSDSGFASEAEYVINKAGHANVLVIRIGREGHSFEGDSRSYWDHPHVKIKTINNNLTKHDLTMRVLSAIIRQWPDTFLLREPDWIKE